MTGFPFPIGPDLAWFAGSAGLIAGCNKKARTCRAFLLRSFGVRSASVDDRRDQIGAADAGEGDFAGIRQRQHGIAAGHRGSVGAAAIAIQGDIITAAAEEVGHHVGHRMPAGDRIQEFERVISGSATRVSLPDPAMKSLLPPPPTRLSAPEPPSNVTGGAAGCARGVQVFVAAAGII